MSQDYGARLKSEAKFRSPQKAKPKPVTTITITFERMPGLISPVCIEFRMRYPKIHAVVTHPYPLYCLKNEIHKGATVICHDVEKGMRLSVQKALSPYVPQHHIYRMFRRWMWLAKQQWYIGKISPIDPLIVKYFTQDHYTQHSEDIFQPGKVIAREFGKVTVEVK